MFFRGSGQNGHNEYFPQNKPSYENTPRVTFNNSFTVSQRPDLQEKVYKNFEPQIFNPPHQNILIKPDQNLNYEEPRQRPVSFYGGPSHAQTSHILGNSVFENSHLPIEQEMMTNRNERGEMMEKMKKIQEELFHRDKIIKIKENEILELKRASSISKLTKKNSFGRLSESKPEKQQLDNQNKELNGLIVNLTEKLEKAQNENTRLAHKYEELLSKNSYDISRKGKREEILESELSLSEKRHERLKAEHERETLSLKEKIKELEEDKNRSNMESSSVNYYLNNYSEHLEPSKSNGSKNLNSSTFEIDKLQTEIQQKNEMIKYLQMQSFRESQAKGSVQDYEKISQLYDQSRQDNVNIQKEVEKLKSEADDLRKEKIKCENTSKELRESYEKVIREMKEENRNKEKKEEEQRQVYEYRIKELSTLLHESSAIVSKQSMEMESGIKKYELIINDIKIKSAEEIQFNNTAIQQHQEHKEKLLNKIAQYESQFRNQSFTINSLEQELAKAKFNEEFIKSEKNKTIHESIGGMQNELKAQIGKTAELMVAKTSLERQCRETKANFETEIEKLIQKLDVSDKRKVDLEQALDSTKLELERMKKSEGEKLCQIAEQQGQKNQILKEYEEEKSKLMKETMNLRETILKQERSEESLKNVILVLEEKVHEGKQQIEIAEQDRNKIHNDNVGLVGKVKDMNSIIDKLKESLMAKEREISIAQETMGTGQVVVELEQKLKRKEEEIERLVEKLNETIFENSRKEKERDTVESKREELIRKEAMRLNEKESNIQELMNKVSQLESILKHKEANTKELEEQIQEKITESIILIQHQNELLSLRADSIAQTEEIKVLRKIIANKETAENQYRNTLEQKLNSLFEMEHQLKTAKEELKKVNSEFSQYKLQEQLRIELKQEHAQTTTISSRSKGKSIKNIAGGGSLSDRGNDEESFVADFIEIDRNALLYICDLLSIVPSEDEVLKNIIEFLEQSSFLKCEKYYVEILELFGVNDGLCEETHLNLICEIKEYRMTISTLIQKMDMLEKRVENTNKENRNLIKELDFKTKDNYVLGDLVVGLNGDLVRNKAKWMSERYGRIESLDVKGMVGTINV